MKEGDIIYLKSKGPRMIIEKVIPPRSTKGGIDNLIGDALAIAPYARVGDFAVKWGNSSKPKRDILPKDTVIDNTDNVVIEKKNDDIILGSVVKSKLDDIEMTVTWIIGETRNSAALYDYSEILKSTQGRADLDLVCRWFEDNELKTGYFAPTEVEKIKE